MINYSFLANSIDYYQKVGFERIEAPWLVSKPISDITKPSTAVDYSVKYDGHSKSFVASGEQSFLYLINKGFLPRGRYQTITPCLRYEEFDDYHTKYFMKNELIDIKEVNETSLHNIIETARHFFLTEAGKRSAEKNVIFDASRIWVLQISDMQYDINFDDVEIGSYGIRHCNFCSWVYGTGLAEPRFSRLLEFRI